MDSSVDNCLVCLVDSLRFDAIEAHEEPGYLAGHDLRQKLHTPTLNELYDRGEWVPNLHAPFTGTPPSVTSLLTGLYPREHHVYGFQRLLHPEVQTLPDYFSVAGYRTILMNGHSIFTPSGLAGRFDETMKGPFKRLLEKIRDYNEQGQSVFAYYHTFDVHHPYMLAKYPAGPAQHERAVEVANRLGEEFDDPVDFELEDAYRETDREGVQWECVDGVPLCDYLFKVWKGYVKEKKLPDDPARFMAELYVEGVNQFDQHQLAPVLDFLNNTDSGRNTTFFLTADHGETRRKIDNRWLDEPRISFEHSREPSQDLIRVPGLLVNGPSGTDLSDWKLTSLVDVTPTLLEACEIESSTSVSGQSWLRSPPDSRRIYSEWSEDVRLEDDDFPRPAMLMWHCVLDNDGFKFCRRGTPVTRQDFQQPPEEFIRRVLIKINFTYPTQELVDKYRDQVDTDLSSRKEFVREIFDNSPPWSPGLYRWDRDHFEENNLLEQSDEQYSARAEVLEKNLLARFPDPYELETPRDDSNHGEDEEAMTQALRDLGYL